MAKKIVRYFLLVIVIALVAYNSVYIRKLSNMKGTDTVAFDAPAVADKIWKEKLPVRLDSAITLDALVTTLNTNPNAAFDRYFHALGIGNVRYGLVKITGKVADVNDDDVTLVAKSGGDMLTVKIATEYVYGNAIRDALNVLNIKDFVNTMDLNNVSEQLNKKVRATVLPAFKASVKKQDSVVCTGAIELNKEHYTLNDLEIIPVQIKIIQQ